MPRSRGAPLPPLPPSSLSAPTSIAEESGRRETLRRRRSLFPGKGRRWLPGPGLGKDGGGEQPPVPPVAQPPRSREAGSGAAGALRAGEGPQRQRQRRGCSDAPGPAGGAEAPAAPRGTGRAPPGPGAPAKPRSCEHRAGGQEQPRSPEARSTPGEPRASPGSPGT